MFILNMLYCVRTMQMAYKADKRGLEGIRVIWSSSLIELPCASILLMLESKKIVGLVFQYKILTIWAAQVTVLPFPSFSRSGFLAVWCELIPKAKWARGHISTAATQHKCNYWNEVTLSCCACNWFPVCQVSACELAFSVLPFISKCVDVKKKII